MAAPVHGGAILCDIEVAIARRATAAAFTEKPRIVEIFEADE